MKFLEENWGLANAQTRGYNKGMKTKYTVCISKRAKDAMDRWRLDNDTGRYPLARKVHSHYEDKRPLAARRKESFTARIRPVTVQTNVGNDQIAELLELANLLDITARHDATDGSLISHLLGTFLDAVIMGDLVDTTATPLQPGEPAEPIEEDVLG